MARCWLLITTLILAPLTAADPESDIRHLLAAQQDAWNRGDVHSFMQGYAQSPDTLFVGSEVTRGHAAVLERYLKRYDTPAKMGKLRFSSIEVKLLGAQHAFVLGRFDLERRADGGGAAGGWFTLLFEKRKEGWRIIADHTS